MSMSEAFARCVVENTTSLGHAFVFIGLIVAAADRIVKIEGADALYFRFDATVFFFAGHKKQDEASKNCYFFKGKMHQGHSPCS